MSTASGYSNWGESVRPRQSGRLGQVAPAPPASLPRLRTAACCPHCPHLSLSPEDSSASQGTPLKVTPPPAQGENLQ